MHADTSADFISRDIAVLRILYSIVQLGASGSVEANHSPRESMAMRVSPTRPLITAEMFEFSLSRGGGPRRPSVDQVVCLLGYPRLSAAAGELSVDWGRVERFDGREIIVNIPSYSGASGGEQA